MRQRRRRIPQAAEVDSSKANVSASQHALDEAIAQLNVAKARQATAMVQRRQSEATKPRQVELTEARYKASQAMVKQAEASLNQARLNVGYTNIMAPVSGIVSRKTAEPGIQVSPGQQIMAIVPLDDIWVTANFKETQLKKMNVGQKVEFDVDTLRRQPHLPWPHRQYCGSFGSEVQLASARKRDGQLCKSGAARAM